jgi:hypothetical protein
MSSYSGFTGFPVSIINTVVYIKTAFYSWVSGTYRIRLPLTLSPHTSSGSILAIRKVTFIRTITGQLAIYLRLTRTAPIASVRPLYPIIPFR